MVSRIIQVPAFDLVVFGATGDLACRKIFPALYGRVLSGQMPSTSSIIGVARRKMEQKDFRSLVKQSVLSHFGSLKVDKALLKQFLKCFSYVALDVESSMRWTVLKGRLRDERVRAFYLSVEPKLFDKIAHKLFEMGLTKTDSRIVIEKPLGSDEQSAKILNLTLKKYFNEEQIYRIDHYLGKESVQNLMALRFSNILFEPLWNSKFIDHVQITVAEKIGVLGRGTYYNKSGALRDMVQNHMMQLLCLTAMEPPSKFSPNMVRDEKLKVIRSLASVGEVETVRGQYWSNSLENFLVDVEDEDSRAESYVALKVSINNLRWAGTPFYLRTGKKMKAQVSEIAIVFKEIPHSIFKDKNSRVQNELIIRLQPNEGITLKTNIKEPGPGGMRITSVPLDMTFADALRDKKKESPDAYERLIMDVIRGDQTLFMRGDEVEEAWRWIDAIVENWACLAQSPQRYTPYTDGPKAADQLLQKDGRNWREV